MRDVQHSDLNTFYQHQLDAEATRMAAFSSREYEAFMTHWSKSMAESSTSLQTILVQGQVAGNVVSWQHEDERNVGYWLGREFWGKGIATTALSLFLKQVQERPLFAHVANHNLASMRVLRKCGFCISRRGRYSDVGVGEGEEWIMMLPSDPSNT